MKRIALMGLATLVSTAAIADVTFYGNLKGDFVQTDKMNNDAQASFVTAEPTAGYSKYNKAAQRTMSFRETLLGANFDNGSKVKGTFEMDFSGETENSAGISPSGGNIRVRQANIAFAMTDNGTLIFGKKWSAFSGLNPHTMSTSLYGFNQGNTSFFTDAINYTHSMGDLAVQLELGASGTTAGSEVNKVSTPSQTIRVDYKMDNHHFGVAYVMAQKDAKTIDTYAIDFNADGDTSDAGESGSYKNNVDISATKVFWQGTFDKTEVRAEYAMGKNVVSTGWLTKQDSTIIHKLAATDTQKDMEETAMWLSAKHSFDTWAVFARYGKSEITNKNKSAAAASIVGNAATAIGASLTVDTDVSVYGEYTMVTTDRLRTVGADNLDSADGSIINLGMIYTF